MSDLSPAAILFDANGDPIDVINDGGVRRLAAIGKVLNSSGSQIDPATQSTLADVKTNQESVLDSGNSSTSQLGNGGTFVGTGVDCLGFSAIAITVHSDKDSAVDGMKFQFSMDNVNWDDSYDWNLDASSSTTRRFQFPVTARYFRVNYTNSNQATTEFRCQTILHRQNILTSIHRLKDDSSNDRSAQTMKAAIIAQRTGGPTTNFIPVEADPGGNLKTALGDSIPAGTNNIGDVDVVSSALPSGAATETTLATRATEATLLAADGRLTTIDAVLDAIKDVDGIKKITDQLPAGTNEIGAVAQGTRAAAAAGWPQYVVDSAGNIVGVVLDGSVYRLQTESKVAKGTSALGHLEALDVSTGIVRLKTSMYTQAGDPVSFPSVSESIKNEFVLNGGSSDLLVDGSTTPVVFEYLSDSTHDISLQEIRFTLASNSITFGTNAFGAISGPLTSGLLVEVLVASGTITLYNLVQNESFVNFSSPGGFDWIVSSKDMMTADYVIGGGLTLRAGTTDKVRVTVRDNLSSAGIYFRCFVKGNVAAD